MNPDPDPAALTRTHDLNSPWGMMPDSDPALVALAAVLMNRGLLSADELRTAIVRAAALRR